MYPQQYSFEEEEKQSWKFIFQISRQNKTNNLDSRQFWVNIMLLNNTFEKELKFKNKILQ